MSFGAVAGAVASGVGSLLSNVVNWNTNQQNLKAQQEYNEKQLALQREQYEYQKYYDANKTSISASDYENAGLSKTLGVGNSGSSVTASAQPSGPVQSKFEMNNPVSSFMDTLMQMQGLEMNAQKIDEMRLNNIAYRANLASEVASREYANKLTDAKTSEAVYNLNKAEKRGLATTDRLPAILIGAEYGLKKGQDASDSKPPSPNDSAEDVAKKINLPTSWVEQMIAEEKKAEEEKRDKVSKSAHDNYYKSYSKRGGH